MHMIMNMSKNLPKTKSRTYFFEIIILWKAMFCLNLNISV